ncbi:glycosyltransferase N-terminal domain-containing protein [Acetobacter nitrogenifigens]|uniref:3-deoxy-D-manno-octulosonic acid transferase n=1 Tax=Acetobacter nitrogenifigens DSM 23921 = NBRC 105050 TaxID=1120919 RepID=A0A511X7Q3_9PROT|nr:glycosyltransferase N-terminal domain-containing protein [Acetobacter nitrogenifigens]GEN58968.1 hypothetical protein ANI02nite_08520 [Acetobacter nitrogenifigens DSM 23921 = NBRC 105050]
MTTVPEPSPRDAGSELLRRIVQTCVRRGLALALTTTRWKVDMDAASRSLLLDPAGPGVLVAFWHEALMLAPTLWWWTEPRNPLLRLRVLISRNRDGRMIAGVVAPWRIPALHGSSDRKGKNKGGASALRRLRASLEQGDVVAIMPDGPKGPRREVQAGALALAELTGAPIIPVGVACSGVRAGSWDRMIVPLPFGRGRLVCGPPLVVARGRRDEMRAQLTAGLNEAMAEAGRRLADADYDERLASMRAPVISGQQDAQTTTVGRALGSVWAAIASLIAPGLIVMLRRRVARGKELPARLRERIGLGGGVARPPGSLVWIHAASVGETVSVLPVIRALLACAWGEAGDAPNVLITTGTVTGFKTLAAALPDEIAAGRVVHQFVPLDVPRWVNRFLKRWRPQAFVLTESELWPNMIECCRRVAVPVMVVNGRMSARALAGWRRAPDLAAWTLSPMRWIAARAEEDAARFRALGAPVVVTAGDLKFAAEPLGFDAALLERLRLIVGERPVWLAASTHEGEEAAIFAAAAALRDRYPDLLTIIAPRHPERGAVVAALAARVLPPPIRHDLGVAPRRSQGQWPEASDPVWVADTLGELGVLFRLSRVVFMGNSLFETPGGRGRQGPARKGGGHNPLEPARLGCAIATGPAIENFAATYARLGEAITVVDSVEALSLWLGPLLADAGRAWTAGDAARQAADFDKALPERLARRIYETMAGETPAQVGV